MASIKERIAGLRERYGWIDHVVRMQEHFGSVKAGQQAGAITYFAFLSFFPILALAFFTVGVVSTVVDGANDALRSAIESLFPGMIGQGEGQLQLSDFRTFTGLAGVIGLAGVLYSGLGWISALRQALVTVFELPEDELLGFVAGKLRDLVVLASIGLTLLVAVGVSGLVSGFSADLLDFVGLDQELSWLVKLITVVLGLAANALLFFTIFKLLGRAEVPNRSLWSGAILGAVLFELLKRLAGLIIAQTQGQPAFQAFGIALVMLVWINYFSRLVLYAAAWSYTAPEARAAREAAALADRASSWPPDDARTTTDARQPPPRLAARRHRRLEPADLDDVRPQPRRGPRRRRGPTSGVLDRAHGADHREPGDHRCAGWHLLAVAAAEGLSDGLGSQGCSGRSRQEVPLVARRTERGQKGRRSTSDQGLGSGSVRLATDALHRCCDPTGPTGGPGRHLVRTTTSRCGVHVRPADSVGPMYQMQRAGPPRTKGRPGSPVELRLRDPCAWRRAGPC